MRRFDVLILGAGIVGCACALECVKAGLRVAIIEPGVIGGAATAAGMGHIVVMDDSPAQLALTKFSRSLWNQLRPQLPLGVEFEQRGTIWVAADDSEMTEVHKKHTAYSAAGVESQILSPRALANAEPNLRSGLAGGLLITEDAVIYPPLAAQFFLDQALLGGAELLQGKAAQKVTHELVTLDDGTNYTAKWIVVATGADKKILPWLPIEKRKGHLLITDRYPDFLHHQLVELGYLKSAHSIQSDSVAFNIQPRSTGQLLLGSSRQYGNDSPNIDPKIMRQMLRRASDYMPALANLSAIRTWTGFRAATPDKLPLIGPTSTPSIFLAAGFEGLGITNAPAAARLLVDTLIGRSSEINPAPYLPSRFSSLELNHA